eukprot:6443-Heterococcus_DN1.PRE.2
MSVQPCLPCMAYISYSVPTASSQQSHVLHTLLRASRCYVHYSALNSSCTLRDDFTQVTTADAI